MNKLSKKASKSKIPKGKPKDQYKILKTLGPMNTSIKNTVDTIMVRIPYLMSIDNYYLKFL